MIIISSIRWQSVVDFSVLVAALYILLLWARETRALRSAIAIVGLHLGALCAAHLDLTITSWMFDGAALALIGLLVLLFQDELRRSLLRLDTIVQLRFHPPVVSKESWNNIARATFDMASRHTGALMVVTRKNSVSELVSNGVSIDAAVSRELLEAIFLKDSPIHDGAVIIERDKIAKAGVVLPLTNREDVRADFGTRHRAAMGLAEKCDAAVLVVSEERGEVSLIEGRQVRRVPDIFTLERDLQRFEPGRKRSFNARLNALLFANLKYRLAAVGLASAILGLSSLSSGMTVKDVVVPVEFSSVPTNLYIVSQPVRSVNVQLRGNDWVMRPMMSGLTVNLDLTGLEEGPHTIPVSSNELRLPPGVAVEHVWPQSVSIRLARRDLAPVR